MIKPIEACSISNQGCEAPAGYRTGGGGIAYGTVSARCTCHRCGSRVCGKCSSMKKKKRICQRCKEEDMPIVKGVRVDK